MKLNLTYGSRWELFLDLENIDLYLFNKIKESFLEINISKNLKIIIEKLKENIFSYILIKKNKIFLAFPFFFNLDCKKKVIIKKIYKTSSNEFFIEIITNNNSFIVSSIDYQLNKKEYNKKEIELYFTAISYTFSKFDLLTNKFKELISLGLSHPDEYTFTAKINNINSSIYFINLEEYNLLNLPVYVPSLYLKTPEINDYAIGDFWITCFSERFVKLLK